MKEDSLHKPEKRKTLLRTPAHNTAKGECVIPPAMSVEALSPFIRPQPESEEQAIRDYVEWQARDEKVKYLEKVVSESIFGQKMDAWDVRTDKARWWVITNPTNLYSQDLFPSLDYTLSFHVGLTTRVAQHEMSDEQIKIHDRINVAWNRLAHARHALFEAEKAEDFQSVGMKCRECLLFLVESIASEEMIPKGGDRPQKANFLEWCDLIADNVVAGASNERMRAYLKTVAKSTWQLVNWLTHTQHANKFDAIIATDAAEATISAYLTALARHRQILAQMTEARAQQ